MHHSHRGRTSRSLLSRSAGRPCLAWRGEAGRSERVAVPFYPFTGWSFPQQPGLAPLRRRPALLQATLQTHAKGPAMTIQVGDRIPQTTFIKSTPEGPQPVDSESFFKGRRVA